MALIGYKTALKFHIRLEGQLAERGGSKHQVAVLAEDRIASIGQS
jgi:hypothetical protein